MAKRKNNSDLEVGLVVGGLALLAIWASNKAYKSARETDVPLIIEEGNSLYELFPDGTKRFIKKLPRINRELPPNFTFK